VTAKPVFQKFPLHRLFSRLPWHSETARKQQASPVASINHLDQLTFSNHSDRSVQPAEERKPGIAGKRAPDRIQTSTFDSLERGSTPDSKLMMDQVGPFGNIRGYRSFVFRLNDFPLARPGLTLA
jgi:hypothetical protein